MPPIFKALKNQAQLDRISKKMEMTTNTINPKSKTSDITSLKVGLPPLIPVIVTNQTQQKINSETDMNEYSKSAEDKENITENKTIVTAKGTPLKVMSQQEEKLMSLADKIRGNATAVINEETDLAKADNNVIKEEDVKVAADLAVKINDNLVMMKEKQTTSPLIIEKVETVIKDVTAVKQTLETEKNNLNKVNDEVKKVDDSVVGLSEGPMAEDH